MHHLNVCPCEADLSCRLMHSICAPYNGEDLVWHPVTPSMSSLSYQFADASKNIKRPNIASFFSPKASKSQTPSKVKRDSSTDSPNSTIKASTTKLEAASSPKVSGKPEHEVTQEASAFKTAAPSTTAMQPQQHEADSKQDAFKAKQSGDVQQVQFPAADGTQDTVAVAEPALRTELAEDVALNPDDGDGVGKPSLNALPSCFGVVAHRHHWLSKTLLSSLCSHAGV